MIKSEELTNPASCMSRAREDEMTFVLLGRDPAAPAAIRAWADERIRLEKNGPNDDQIREAHASADAIAAQLPPPEALAVLKNGQWVVRRCPLCGKRHFHGAGGGDDDPRKTLGHRVKHCIVRGPDNRAGGYILVDSDPARTLRVAGLKD